MYTFGIFIALLLPRSCVRWLIEATLPFCGELFVLEITSDEPLYRGPLFDNPLV